MLHDDHGHHHSSRNGPARTGGINQSGPGAPEQGPRAKRSASRTFSAEFKRAIVREYDAAPMGSKGDAMAAFLCRMKTGTFWVWPLLTPNGFARKADRALESDRRRSISDQRECRV